MINLTTENFDEVVLKTPVVKLVDFYTNECFPCRQMMPVLNELDASSEGSYLICKVNGREEIDLSRKYEINAVPTFLIFNSSGEVVERLMGIQSKENLLKILKSWN